MIDMLKYAKNLENFNAVGASAFFRFRMKN